LKIASPAKINLSLSVGRLLPQGYHRVDSYVHLITLEDTLTLTQAEVFSFSSSTDLGIPDHRNLAVRAIKGMADIYHKELPNLCIHLEKNIPHGAGLGGGSSNAAAAIYAMASLWKLPSDDPRHLQLAQDLGSDVPLFLAPTTASIMTGTGSTLKESRMPIPDMPLLIAMPPGAHSPTAQVYQTFDQNPVDAHDLQEWTNNLEAAAIAVAPETGSLLAWLRGQKEVEIAQVSGSGASCWASTGSTADAEDLHLLAHKAREQGYLTFEATTAQVGIRQLLA